MVNVNIRHAKAHFSAYVARVEAGETFQLCRRNVPVAELRSIPVQHHGPRPIGLAKGQFTVPASFFDALPDDAPPAVENPAA